MVEFSRGKLYLAVLALMLLVAGVIALYTYIENYTRDRRARKRKAIFKTKGGKTKGYWKTKKGEEYDKDLKLED
jgi:peptidoglycan/LPS O-acetylase OafA/YrhL